MHETYIYVCFPQTVQPINALFDLRYGDVVRELCPVQLLSSRDLRETCTP